MTLGRLGISNIRNIKSANLELGPNINLFIGANGSGKTSLLESVYFLGTGRTFRSGTVDPLIARGEPQCTVFGSVTDGHGRRMSVGVQRSRDDGREIRINGAKAEKASALARVLPTLVLGPNTVELVSGAPALRRQFLNWGVFHVEPSFVEVWEQLGRCLKQRNELLRRPGTGVAELAVWDEQFCRLGEHVHAQRAKWFEAFEACFASVTSELTHMSDVRCRYEPGWDPREGLAGSLARLMASDQQRGYTQAGPQRADIRVTVGGEMASKVCSRGELKILAWAMLLTQGRLYGDTAGTSLVYLVDDLASELDAGHRERVCEFLARARGQVLVTAIDRHQFENCWQAPELFHVEHGAFSVEERVNDRR